MKRTLAILLAALMLMGMATVAIAEDTKTISYYAYFCGEHEDECYIENYVEEGLGIEINVKKVAHTDGDAVNLMIAQDMPDCGWFTKTPTYMQEQELIRTIPVEMVREYAPGLIEIMDDNPILWGQCSDPEDETQLLYLPALTDLYNQQYPWAFYLRYDWVKALNIDLGVEVEQINDRLYAADKGLTLEKVTEVMRAFVMQDPDGDGANDTYGYVKDYTQFMSAFNLHDTMANEDGTVTRWFTHPNVKEMLTYLQGIYTEGLLYPEIFTIGSGVDWELINNGAAGLFASGTNNLNAWSSNRPPLTLLEQVPEAELLAIPGIADENGVTVRERSISVRNAVEYFYVRWDISDEKLVEILKFYEWCNHNDDLTVLATLWKGEEGVHWEWNEDQTAPVVLENLVAGDHGAQIFTRDTQMNETFFWISVEPLCASGGKYWLKQDGGLWMADVVYPYKNDILNETNAAAISNEYGADWNATRDTYFLDVITGAKNVESDWDAYIQELNDLHYGEYLAELDKLPTVEEMIAEYSN